MLSRGSPGSYQTPLPLPHMPGALCITSGRRALWLSVQILNPRLLASSPSSNTCKLCDLGQVTGPLCAPCPLVY